MTRVRGLAAVIAVVAVGGVLAACPAAEAPPATPAADVVAAAEAPAPLGMNPEAKRLEDLPAGVNAVQNEMRLLDVAMRDVLTLIANNTLEPVGRHIYAIHGARDLTEHAIASGAYKPPRGDEPIEAFLATDRAFHDDLVRLVKAARANDLEAATKAYADVVLGCTACHQRFRFGAP